MSLYHRVFNFSAGPGTLPVPVLEHVRDEMLNHAGDGMSVLEMSHRGGPYDRIHSEAKEDLKTLLGIPDGYQVLFLAGGASLQFTMVAKSFGTGSYVVTGAWGEKAVEAAALEGDAHVAWKGDRSVPACGDYDVRGDYVHITTNETIGGVQWKEDPSFDLPLVCDMSSDILSRPAAVDRYSLIYAGAQKNMGPAGATLVVVSDEFLKRVPKGLPPMLDYAVQAKNDSRYNTPPTFSIYVCGLVYKHLLKNGGLAEAEVRNQRKSGLLYAAIDSADGFYEGHAETASRSTMNVVFTLPSKELTDLFVTQATENGFDGLRGHRNVGGIRASIYNAFLEEGCVALADFMRDFAQRNG